MNILFVASGTFKLDFHGYRTRVLTSLESVNNILGNCSLLVNEPFFRVFFNGKKRKEIKEYAMRSHIRVYINYLLPERVPFGIFINRWLVSRKLKRICCKERMDIIHIHNNFYPFIDQKLKERLKVKVIFDYHGLAPEEAEMAGYCKEGDKKFNLMRRTEKVCIENADYLVCVSRSLGEFIRNNIIDKEVTIVPCCVDTHKFKYTRKKRERMRSKFNLQDKFVVVYSGNFSVWNPKEETIKVFLYIKRYFSNAYFLILTATRYHRFLKNLLSRESIGIEDFMIADIDHDKMPDYLMMGDLGLLIRKRFLVNQVAFPTKFAEYLACCLPVLATSAVHDIKRIVENQRLGIVIEDVEDEKSIRKAVESLLKFYKSTPREEIGKRCKAFAKEFLSCEFGTRQYLRAYESIRGRK